MTTGNDPYLEHLRGQLTEVLEDVSPPAAPAAAIKRRGKAMRVRRRAGIAAGLLAAVIAAVLIPGLLRLSTASTPYTKGHRNPRVTVGIVGPNAPHGVIARGAIDGKPWQILLAWQGKDLCVRPFGALADSGCGPLDTYGGQWPATLDGLGGAHSNALYGIVAGKVQRVSVALSDGVVLDLSPVTYEGRQWIGVEIPVELKVTRLVAYSRGGELAHTMPFTAKPGGLPSVSEWQRPGQATPREFVRVIASGVSAGKPWKVTVHLGPWGLCVTPAIPGDGTISCTTSAVRPGVITSSGVPPQVVWAVAVAQPRVSYLMLTMTDRSMQRVPVVQVGKLRLYAIVIFHKLPIAHWAAYDSSGHRLYGGQGGAAFE